MPLPQHDPLTHKLFFCSLIIGHVGEYFKATYASAPFSLTPTSSSITLTFIAVHLDLDGYFLLFLKDYKPNQYFELSSDSFKVAFQNMPHLLASNHFGMVF
jgi:hypothetical protein